MQVLLTEIELEKIIKVNYKWITIILEQSQ